MNALAREIYQPVVLNVLGQTIQRFCLENPCVAFNSPPDFQEEFVRYIESLEDMDVRFKYRNRIFYENRPLVNYLKKIRPDEMLLAFIPDKKIGGLTLLAKIENILKADEIPPNWRLDFHPTKNFRRYFGEGNLWTSCIAAITRVVSLKKEMCWPDPKARIFMAKAARHGVE